MKRYEKQKVSRVGATLHDDISWLDEPVWVYYTDAWLSSDDFTNSGYMAISYEYLEYLKDEKDDWARKAAIMLCAVRPADRSVTQYVHCATQAPPHDDTRQRLLNRALQVIERCKQLGYKFDTDGSRLRVTGKRLNELQFNEISRNPMFIDALRQKGLISVTA